MRRIIVTDIYHFGEKYGAWARSDDNIGYPAIQPFMKEAEKKSDPSVEPFDDDTGMFVHDCLLKMRRITPEHFDIFMYKFVSRLGVQQICEKLDISDTTYKRNIYAALSSLKLLVTEDKCIFLA
ncbi:antiterminator Q family protein [Rodentibacter caecimuris]|uniref:antiterminator Q family protein n=1 Tax=Rodentibacter caecimuris TaxID=1796644 RepID=UPI00211A32B2|nr:antiterminator Q family protein [Rodentibacter heylii]MCQ9124342.1 RNA polymerase subunit sigma-70 [Rodentibacter heylii]